MYIPRYYCGISHYQKQWKLLHYKKHYSVVPFLKSNCSPLQSHAGRSSVTVSLARQVPYGCTALMGEDDEGHWKLLPPCVLPVTYSGIMEYDWRVLLWRKNTTTNVNFRMNIFNPQRLGKFSHYYYIFMKKIHQLVNNRNISKTPQSWGNSSNSASYNSIPCLEWVMLCPLVATDSLLLCKCCAGGPYRSVVSGRASAPCLQYWPGTLWLEDSLGLREWLRCLSFDG